MTDREEKRLEREALVQKRAADEQLLRAEYFKIKDSLAFLDLQAKLTSFIQFHQQVATDGVGVSPKGEVIKLSPAERVSELDKVAGIEEITSYLERKLAD